MVSPFPVTPFDREYKNPINVLSCLKRLKNLRQGHEVQHSRCTSWPCLKFLRLPIWNVNIFKMVTAKKSGFDFYSLLYFSSILRMLYSATMTYNFKGKPFQTLISRERWQLMRKYVIWHWYRHCKWPCPKLSKVNFVNANISETVRPSVTIR